MRKKQNNKKNKLDFLEGTIQDKDSIACSYVNTTNPRYIELDGVFYSGLIISNYYRNYSDLILKKLIDTNINMNISIFYEKQEQKNAESAGK